MAVVYPSQADTTMSARSSPPSLSRTPTARSSSTITDSTFVL